MFPSEPESILWNSYSIDSRPYRHGTTTTNFFIIDTCYGYLTDISPDQLIDVCMWDMAHDLDELFVEANYDESYKAYMEQAMIANNYNVESGFSRHLSRQESSWLVSSLKPKVTHFIHKSSRFYETVGGDKE